MFFGDIYTCLERTESKQMIKNSSILRKNSEVVEKFGEEELLLFDPILGRLFEINISGKRIWELCDGNHSIEEIIKILKEEFWDANEASIDVPQFLSTLLQFRLVEIC
jgi:hypothetical protein